MTQPISGSAVRIRATAPNASSKDKTYDRSENMALIKLMERLHQHLGCHRSIYRGQSGCKLKEEMAMSPDGLPDWMRYRIARKVTNDSSPSIMPAIALLMLFGLLVWLSINTALNHPSYFHLPVNAAGAVFLGFLIAVRIECTKTVARLFILAAIQINLAMTYLTEAIEPGPSPLLALAGVTLFTGLIGLYLFSRTIAKPSRLARGAMLGMVVTLLMMSLFIPFYLPEGPIHPFALNWCHAAAAPLAFLFVMTFWLVNAYHRTDKTMPYDNWG